jgi:hypothetical protein
VDEPTVETKGHSRTVLHHGVLFLDELNEGSAVTGSRPQAAPGVRQRVGLGRLQGDGGIGPLEDVALAVAHNRDGIAGGRPGRMAASVNGALRRAGLWVGPAPTTAPRRFPNRFPTAGRGRCREGL